ncbi:conjugative transposon protein TraM [Flavobacterium poyangense]|uniref:conjugative transposon protein TraM n=1 Tax=Flavobacterium poyangense TaxID=2204302 RepID=UPI0014232BC4|nr:conjugative transposon protein TraM [Flavobacterium sp. JXAS1]
MEKNKKILVIGAFVGCMALLAGSVYMIFSKEKVENEKPKVEFEVPKVNKNEKPASKFDYYNKQVDRENSEDGFLLEKEDLEKENVDLVQQEGFYKEEDFQNPYKKKYQNDYSEKSYNKVGNQGNLNRLLNVMESNSKYLNNIEKEQPPFDASQVLNNPQDLFSKTIESVSIGNNKIKEAIEENTPGNKGNTETNENSSGRVIYKKIPKEEDLSMRAFLGVSKNKNVFSGVVSDNKSLKKELTKAEIYTNQVIGNGGLVMINLLEDLVFEEDFVIPKSTVLYGTVRFSPTRMFISISPNVFKNDKRLLRPVIVFDFDGLEGVFIETNLLTSIPVETAQELTELVKDSYKNANPLTGSSSAVPLKEASIIIGSEKILKYLNRLKLKINGGYKIWISVEKEK